MIERKDRSVYGFHARVLYRDIAERSLVGAIEHFISLKYARQNQNCILNCKLEQFATHKMFNYFAKYLITS